MIKFYRQNQWRDKGQVRAVSIINASVIHCRCGCNEWSIYFGIIGFVFIATYNKNVSK